MILSEYNDLWYRCRPFTEYYIGCLLERDWNLSNLNYYKIPWAGIVREKRELTLPKAGNDLPSVTMCQFSQPHKLIDKFEDLGIRHVFSPHSGYDTINGIRFYPIAHYPIRRVSNQIPIEDRTLLYSFVGMINHPIRQQLKELRHPNDSLMVFRTEWNQNDDADGCFAQSLRSSKFVLCPRGWGRGTIRFWEAIQAGCVPVVFDKLDLPRNPLWSRAIIEFDGKLDDLEGHLRSYKIEDLKEKHDVIKLLAKRYLGQSMVKPIADSLGISRVYPYHNHSIQVIDSSPC